MSWATVSDQVTAMTDPLLSTPMWRLLALVALFAILLVWRTVTSITRWATARQAAATASIMEERAFYRNALLETTTNFNEQLANTNQNLNDRLEQLAATIGRTERHAHAVMFNAQDAVHEVAQATVEVKRSASVGMVLNMAIGFVELMALHVLIKQANLFFQQMTDKYLAEYKPVVVKKDGNVSVAQLESNRFMPVGRAVWYRVSLLAIVGALAPLIFSHGIEPFLFAWKKCTSIIGVILVTVSGFGAVGEAFDGSDEGNPGDDVTSFWAAICSFKNHLFDYFTFTKPFADYPIAAPTSQLQDATQRAITSIKESAQLDDEKEVVVGSSLSVAERAAQAAARAGELSAIRLRNESTAQEAVLVAAEAIADNTVGLASAQVLKNAWREKFVNKSVFFCLVALFSITVVAIYNMRKFWKARQVLDEQAVLRTMEDAALSLAPVVTVKEATALAPKSILKAETITRRQADLEIKRAVEETNKFWRSSKNIQYSSGDDGPNDLVRADRAQRNADVDDAIQARYDDRWESQALCRKRHCDDGHCVRKLATPAMPAPTAQAAAKGRVRVCKKCGIECNTYALLMTHLNEKHPVDRSTRAPASAVRHPQESVSWPWFRSSSTPAAIDVGVPASAGAAASSTPEAFSWPWVRDQLPNVTVPAATILAAYESRIPGHDSVSPNALARSVGVVESTLPSGEVQTANFTLIQNALVTVKHLLAETPAETKLVFSMNINGSLVTHACSGADVRVPVGYEKADLVAISRPHVFQNAPCLQAGVPVEGPTGSISLYSYDSPIECKSNQYKVAAGTLLQVGVNGESRQCAGAYHSQRGHCGAPIINAMGKAIGIHNIGDASGRANRFVGFIPGVVF